MNKLFTIACLVSIASPLVADEQVDAWAIIDRAIEAHGGRDKVLGFKAGMWRATGTLQMPTGPAKVDAVMYLQHPNRTRTDLQLQIGEQTVSYSAVVDNDQGWLRIGTVNTPMPPTSLAEAKAQLYTTWMAMFLPLKKRDGFKLSMLPEKEIADEPSVGVRIRRENHRTVDLYFSKQSGLRISSEYEVVDEMMRTTQRQETVYAAYRDYGGVQQPVFTTIKRGGKVFMVVQLKEFVASDELDAKLFQLSGEE